MAEAASIDGSDVPVTSDGRRRYVLTLLLGAYTLSFLDRQVVTILAEPIKHDLHLQDWQLGVLTGLVFAIFYTSLGIPIAWLADRRSRPAIIAACMALWSAFTVLSGRAASFAPLLFARLGVGFGEAGCNPSSHSLIADIAPGDKRASALSFYSLGVPIGTLLGLGVGGLVADAYGWRAAFLLAGAPGLALSVLIFLTVREPRGRAGAGRTAQSLATYLTAMRELAGKRTFWLVAVAAGLMAFAGYAQQAFFSSFFLRNHGPALDALAAGVGLKSKGFLGLCIGSAVGGGGLAGTLLGGMLADRAAARDRRGYMTVPAIAAALAVPFTYLIFLVGDPLVALALIAVPSLLGTLWYGPVYATAQSVVRPQNRAMAAAILLFVLNLIGLGLGPLCVGALSTYLSKTLHYGDADGVRWALIISANITLASAWLFWLGRKTVREDVVS
jgi:predicted MFS family arabinose efflux permease